MGVIGIPELLVGAPVARGRGRPMSPHTERAILDARTALLAERPLAQITIEEVAERARVSKASVYRRWPSKGTLAFDAFVGEFLTRLPYPDTGSLEEDLRISLRGWVRVVRETTGRGRCEASSPRSSVTPNLPRRGVTALLTPCAPRRAAIGEARDRSR